MFLELPKGDEAKSKQECTLFDVFSGVGGQPRFVELTMLECRSARMQLDRTSVPWALFCFPNAGPCKMVHKWLMAFSAGCDAATTGGPVFLCFFLWVDPRRNGVV